MKKIMFMLVIMFAMSMGTTNAQVDEVHLSGTIGITECIEPHSTGFFTFTSNVDLGIGGHWDSGVYGGIGVSPGICSERISDNNNWYVHDGFNMPFYLQIGYVHEKQLFLDIKFGGEYVNSSRLSGTYFYTTITPGWTFDKHSSVGIGWKYHAKNIFDGNAISLMYRYTF